jgi:hypothetical protein
MTFMGCWRKQRFHHMSITGDIAMLTWRQMGRSVQAAELHWSQDQVQYQEPGKSHHTPPCAL